MNSLILVIYYFAPSQGTLYDFGVMVAKCGCKIIVTFVKVSSQTEGANKLLIAHVGRSNYLCSLSRSAGIAEGPKYEICPEMRW